MLKIGKLYSCKDYFLLLYPDMETAIGPVAVTAAAADLVAEVAAYWSRELGKPVSYCNPETPLLFLNTDNEYAEVLAGDKRGWIVNGDGLKIKEIIDDAA